MPFLTARDEWLARHPLPWDEATAAEFAHDYDGVAEKWLDEGHGACLLKDGQARRIVEDALRHFDGMRYALYAFVVMPNHVHVLFMPEKGEALSRILHSWKSFTAHQLSDRVTGGGAVWQKESWDRLIRNEEHFRRV